MSASDDDASIPLVQTARKPGYVPPKEYVQYLDMGGELAKLFSLKDTKSLKTAVQLLKNRSVAVVLVQVHPCSAYCNQDLLTLVNSCKARIWYPLVQYIPKYVYSS